MIKSLPWKPFCLDAGHGWICVGGDEKGQCAFISIDLGSAGRPVSRSNYEVDDLLPLDLDPEYRHQRQEVRRSLSWSPYVVPPKYELHLREFGGERVNSVTIHSLKNVGEGLRDETVVVIT